MAEWLVLFSVIWQPRVLISFRPPTGFIFRLSRIQFPGLDSSCCLCFDPHISFLDYFYLFIIILMGCWLASWKAKCIST